MKRRAYAVIGAIVAASTVALAQRATPPAAPPPARKVSTAATCGAELGTGLKTKRRFCDVVISRDPAAGVVIAVPAHRGTATLKFELHNRFTIPAADVPAAQVFVRQLAVVAVLRMSGAVISRAAVVSELRTPADIFDQIAGVGAAPPKVIAPGLAELIEVTVPAGLSSVSIVGVSLEATNRTGKDLYDAPGRPVAIVSNWRVEYTPATATTLPQGRQ
jgi:hypothetical protein